MLITLDYLRHAPLHGQGNVEYSRLLSIIDNYFRLSHHALFHTIPSKRPMSCIGVLPSGGTNLHSTINRLYCNLLSDA